MFVPSLSWQMFGFKYEFTSRVTGKKTFFPYLAEGVDDRSVGLEGRPVKVL